MLDDATGVSIAAPAFVSMRVAGSTAKRRVGDGDAPAAYFGAAFRRLGRTKRPAVDAGDRARGPVAGDRHHSRRAPDVGTRAGLGRRSAVDRLPDEVPAGRHGRAAPTLAEPSTPVIVARDGERPADTAADTTRRQTDRPSTRPAQGAGRGQRPGVPNGGDERCPVGPFDFEVERPVMDGRIITTCRTPATSASTSPPRCAPRCSRWRRSVSPCAAC